MIANARDKGAVKNQSRFQPLISLLSNNLFVLGFIDLATGSVSMFELDRTNVARHVTTELLQCVTHRPDYGIGIARDCRL